MKIVFLARQSHFFTGSSILRGHQVSTICQLLFSDTNFEFYFTHDTSHISNARLIFTKSFAATTSIDEIDSLRKRGNQILLDCLDIEVHRGVLAAADALIASSRQQLAYYRAEFPSIRSTLMSHHVDLRIPTCEPIRLYWKSGYFGEVGNAANLSELNGLVEVVSAIDPLDNEWIKKLNDVNCHYAVRRSHKYDGFKPFTKGFVAAYRESPIVVANDDIEAISYLGSEYPFTIDRERPIRPQMIAIQEQFGGPNWVRALDVMCSVREYVSAANIKMEISEAILF
jgi:hypothetical protein